ncbi:MAG TPA: DUF6065 family protein, partial [Stellaceae bacterium]|nr:DUF6065 family protein [Stellaceae bacterium]
QPEIRKLDDDPELARQHNAFATSRNEFMKRFYANDPEALKNPWLKFYFRGRHPDGGTVDNHLNKLRLAPPVDKRCAVSACRCQSRGSLNRVPRQQTHLNELGRSRLTDDGRLRESHQLQSRTSSDDWNCLIVEKFLDDTVCERLCDAFSELSSTIVNRAEHYWDGRFIWHSDVAAYDAELARHMRDAQRAATALIADFYQLAAPIYPDLLQIMSWPAGIHMPPHADNAYPDGSPHPMAHRDFSGIIYLNDDYQGGEFYFTGLDTVIKPKKGMLVAFTAGFYHEHAVLRVDGGQRFTMPFFLTFDKNRADPSLL